MRPHKSGYLITRVCDLMVICSGCNDYELNEFSSTFQNITNFIKTNNHTNIILISVPFRYDLLNSTAVNSSISNVNRKLKKLVIKYFNDNSKKHVLDSFSLI